MTRADLRPHYRRMHNYLIYKPLIQTVVCRECGARMCYGGFPAHMKNMHIDKPSEVENDLIDCPICLQRFSIITHYVQHLKNDHGIN